MGHTAGLIDAEEYLQFHQNIPSGRVQKLPSYQGVLPPAEPAGRSLAALAEVLFEQKACQQRADARGMCWIPARSWCLLGSRSNTAKTARDLCNLTRNPTKNLWYHGVKLHVFANCARISFPFPAPYRYKASLCDLWAAKQIDLDCAPVTDGRLCKSCYIDAE